MEIKIIKNKNFIYKVKQNETLLDVSNKFKVLESELMNDNCLTNKTLLKGDLLYISSQNALIYVVKPLENLNIIARKLNVTKQQLVEKNHLKTENVFIGQKLIV